MTATVIRMTVGIVVVLMAWSVGHIQGQARMGEFEIEIKSPDGRTTLICKKGCNWDKPETWFECTGGTCGAVINQDGFILHRD
jgi:hypothetical protein